MVDTETTPTVEVPETPKQQVLDPQNLQPEHKIREIQTLKS